MDGLSILRGVTDFAKLQMQQGWPVSEVTIEHETNCFEMPEEHVAAFKQYYSDFYEEKGFVDDRDKFPVTHNPVAFSDAPTLALRTRLCKYSQACFYRDRVAQNPVERDALIHDLVRGSLEAHFPHVFALLLTVVTSDNKILLVERAPKLQFMPGLWSCTLEEQLASEDFADGPQRVAFNVCRRMLKEELGELNEQAYRPDDMRLLSVALESNTLTIVMCGYATLRLDAAALDDWLHAPTKDVEFIDWEFLDLSREALLRELRAPSHPYHPMTGYRMGLMFLNQFGLPTQSDRF